MTGKSKEEMKNELPDLVKTIMEFKENKKYPESSLKTIKKMYKQLYSLDIIQAMGENVAQNYDIKMMDNDFAKGEKKIKIFVLSLLGPIASIPLLASLSYSLIVLIFYLYLTGVILFNTFVVDKVLQNNFEKKHGTLQENQIEGRKAIEEFKKYLAKKYGFNYFTPNQVRSIEENGLSMADLLFEKTDTVAEILNDGEKNIINKEVDKLSKQRDDNIEKLIHIKDEFDKALNKYSDIVEKESEKIEKLPIPENLLFIYGEEGEKKIDPRFLDNLKEIDLSNISFDNVDVHGIDFTDCNPVLLNPQTVWKKDLSGTTFISDPSRPNNVFPFGARTDFYGVNLKGATIKTEDLIYLELYGAEMDEDTLISIRGEVISNGATKTR